MHTNSNIALLDQLIDSLQACFSPEDVYTAIGPLMQQLFPNEAGAIYLLSSSKNLLEAIASWGAVPLTSDRIFTPNECLALRRCHTHCAEDTHNSLLCQHIHPHDHAVETVCVPMMVHGETLGVLYVSSLKRGRIAETQKLAVIVAKQIGLALSNLKLRESLKNQSFRDPLTLLYNRRYLEESLEREIRRCDRKPEPLGIILINIDCFQQFNEQFGRAAGDLLLREIGLFLPRQIRSSDIACRYGGQEFLLVLPEISLEGAQKRAEQLRHDIKYLKIDYKHQTLNSITISCGVASFSEHGITGKALIRAARTALKRAKEQGRDCTVVHAS
ncbi:MAG: sensor domain-containing diguanylate cyclase [Potamolinea sp.]